MASNDNKRYHKSQLALASKNIKSKYWYKSIKLLLFLHNLDIFAIYKTKVEHSNTKSAGETDHGKDEIFASAPEARKESVGSFGAMTGSVYQQKELKMANTCDDSRRHRWTLPIRMFILYLFIKTLIISIAQYSLIKHKVLMPRGYSSPWLSVEAAETISRYLGNPLSELHDISLIAYFGPSLFTFLLLVLFPAYLRMKPLNLAPLRFIFKPCHELKRIDLIIHQDVEDLKVSLRLYFDERISKLIVEWTLRQRSQFGLTKAKSQPSSLGELVNSIHREQLYCVEVEKYLTELETQHLDMFRPAIYSVEHYLDTTAKIGAVVIGNQIQFSVVWILCSVAIVLYSYNAHCNDFLQSTQFSSNHTWSSSSTSSSSKFCNPLHIFTLPDLTILIELPLIYSLGCLTVTVNMILTTIATVSQVKMIKTIKLDLLECMNQLSRYFDQPDLSKAAAAKSGVNTINVKPHQVRHCPSTVPLVSHSSLLNATNFRLDRASLPCSSSRLQPELVLNLRRRMTNSNCISNSVTGSRRVQQTHSVSDRSRVDRLLLAPLIRMIINRREGQESSRCMSLLTMQNFYHLISATLFAVMGKICRVSDPYYVRAYLLFVACMSFNVVAAACAHLYSRVIELQRIMWRVMAANAKIIAIKSKQHEARDIEQRSYGNDDGGHSSSSSGSQSAHHGEHIDFDTFAVQLWRRFALVNSASLDSYCVRPFDFNFTYENIINANVFFISLYTLAIGLL